MFQQGLRWPESLKIEQDKDEDKEWILQSTKMIMKNMYNNNCSVSETFRYSLCFSLVILDSHISSLCHSSFSLLKNYFFEKFRMGKESLVLRGFFSMKLVNVTFWDR